MQGYTDLPPRPDAPVAPAKPRPRVWPWVLGVVLVLGIAGGISQSGSETTTTTPTPIDAPVDTGLTRTEAMVAAGPLTDAATAELEAIQTSSSVAEMADHLNRASDITEQMAGLFDGVDDAMAGYLHSAAGHYAAAAEEIGSGRITAGTAEIEAATADINSATALV